LADLNCNIEEQSCSKVVKLNSGETRLYSERKDQETYRPNAFIAASIPFNVMPRVSRRMNMVRRYHNQSRTTVFKELPIFDSYPHQTQRPIARVTEWERGFRGGGWGSIEIL